MTIYSSTPYLPKGARTWPVHDWPTWSTVRRQEEVAPFLNAWLEMAGPARVERLSRMSETCALLLALADRPSYQQCLVAPETGEGFQWAMSSQAMPWYWGAGALVGGATPEVPLACPWTPKQFWNWLEEIEIPEDPTGTLASLAWFHTLTGLVAWWESRVARRLGNCFRPEVDLGLGQTYSVMLCGRRYGPSLSSFK